MVKKALLCGCNYPGSDAELKGCVNDVFGMKSILIDVYGFSESDINILIDNDNSYQKPTGKNIKSALRELIKGTKAGDILVFHYSGHGTQVPSDSPEEPDAKDEAIVPCDMNVMADDDLRAILQDQPDGVKFTMIADCCHSGTLLDHSEVAISGDKSGGSGIPEADTLMGMFGMKELPAGKIQVGKHKDFKNRSMSSSTLMSQLSSLMGGKKVEAGNIRSSMQSLFGADSSAKVQNYMQLAQLGYGVATGKTNKSTGLKSILAIVMKMCGSSSTAGTAAAEGNAATAGTTAGAALGDDKGVLITGCQSTETSADACPSGDPNKAYGALSNALQTVIKTHHKKHPDQPITYMDLVSQVRAMLGKTGFSQNPCLECSAKNADSPFIVT